MAPGRDDEAAAQDALGPLIDDAANAMLIQAAEAFACGRRARATRLIAVGKELLAAEPDRFARSPESLRAAVQWLPIGSALDVAV